MISRHFVVVCGYGCNLDSPLKPYLERVIDFVEYNEVSKEPVTNVVLCGGFTQQKTFPGKSEARVMYDYLQSNTLSRLDFPSRIQFQLEENSYTTHDNILMAANKIGGFKKDWRTDLVPEQFKITIFCEAQRALKVILLSRRFMKDLVSSVADIKTETDSWELRDPDSWKHGKRGELWTTNMTWLAIKFPFLAQLERRKKMEMSKHR